MEGLWVDWFLQPVFLHLKDLETAADVQMQQMNDHFACTWGTKALALLEFTSDHFGLTSFLCHKLSLMIFISMLQVMFLTNASEC